MKKADSSQLRLGMTRGRLLLFLYCSMSRGKDCLMASCAFAKPVPKEPNQTQGLSTFAAKPGMSRDDDILVVRWLSQPPERGAQPGARPSLYAQKRRANGTRGCAVRHPII